MNCYLSGMVGTGLLAGSALTLSISEEQQNKLKEVLSPELVVKYEEIITERRNQYIHGLILGIIVSFIFMYNFKINNRFFKITAFLAITLMIAVFYYTLMPKSDYMLNHLKTEEENKVWLGIYKTMKFRYFMGLVLGAAAAIPFAMILC
jgi:hypothetical protein